MAIREEDLGARQYIASSRISITSDTEEKIKILRKICNSDAVTNRVGNGAHQHTSTIIRNNLPVLFDMDNLSEPSLSLSDLQRDISAYASGAGISTANITNTFTRISSSKSPIDTESQVNVIEVISRAWSLACLMGDGFKTIVASCLSDNIGDGGGCLPGVTARLFGPYAAMLRELFEDALRAQSIKEILKQPVEEEKKEELTEAVEYRARDSDEAEREVVLDAPSSPRPKS